MTTAAVSEPRCELFHNKYTNINNDISKQQWHQQLIDYFTWC